MNIMTEDAIVPIPENRIRFFGGPGKMLLPCPQTISTLIQRVPVARLVTTNILRQQLELEFDVDGVCPITTKKSLWAAAHQADEDLAYWRVVTQKGELFVKFPGGTDAQAAQLKGENFSIDSSGKLPRVIDFKDSLFGFA